MPGLGAATVRFPGSLQRDQYPGSGVGTDEGIASTPLKLSSFVTGHDRI